MQRGWNSIRYFLWSTSALLFEDSPMLEHRSTINAPTNPFVSANKTQTRRTIHLIFRLDLSPLSYRIESETIKRVDVQQIPAYAGHFGFSTPSLALSLSIRRALPFDIHIKGVAKKSVNRHLEGAPYWIQRGVTHSFSTRRHFNLRNKPTGIQVVGVVAILGLRPCCARSTQFPGCVCGAVRVPTSP